MYGGLRLLARLGGFGACMVLMVAGAAAQSPSEEEGAAQIILGSATSDEPGEEAAAMAEQAGAPSIPFNLYAGVDWVTAYNSRGIVFSEEQSIQPWVEVDVPIRDFSDKGFWRDLSAFGGVWASIHDGAAFLGETRSGNVRTVDNFYETDLYTGLRAGFGAHFTGSLRANYYFSPAGSWEDIWEVDGRISYHNTDYWGQWLDGFSMNPSLRITKEIDDGGGPENWYFRPGVEPTYTFQAFQRPITFTVPLMLGFGANKQYVDEDGSNIAFGMVQTGMGVSGPFNVLPKGKGTLRWKAGVDFVIVADKDIHIDNERLSTVGRIGLSYAY